MSRPCEIQPTIAVVDPERMPDGDSISDTARSSCNVVDHKAKKIRLMRPRTTARNNQRRL